MGWYLVKEQKGEYEYMDSFHSGVELGINLGMGVFSTYSLIILSKG